MTAVDGFGDFTIGHDYEAELPGKEIPGNVNYLIYRTLVTLFVVVHIVMRKCGSKKDYLAQRGMQYHFGSCCMDGKVQLPFLTNVPKVLTDLHLKDDEKGRLFMKNIRSFNSMFSFTSMVGKVNYGINNGSGPPSFVLSGQNYHSIGSLVPNDNERPKSNKNVSNIEREIISTLKDMLDAHNPLAKMFRYARDRFKLDNVPDVRLKLIWKRDTDGRRYNLPTVSEVAVLVVSDIDDSIIDRDIIIESTARQLKRIDVLHPQYLALQYSLLFPYAEIGYRNDIETSFWYNIDVDAYTMIEVQRLNFLGFNQCKLRVENYRVLHESFARGEADVVVTSQRIILPSSFTGGLRYMFNNCKDAFTICKYAGYPSYFITITCNPEWTEIKRLLQGTGLQAQDRPDIVSRVFKIKLNNLIRDLKMVNTPKSLSDIDRHISVEIPDQRSRPKLYAAVEKFMVHGPCGKYNKDSPCMINGRCSKFFPKPFRVRTITDEIELCLTDEQILNLTLIKVEEQMQANGRSLRDFKTMPYLSEDDIDGLDDRMIIDELNFDHGILHSQCNKSIQKMTDEQRHAFDEIVMAVQLNLGRFFFLYGYGGTGKTFLYTALSATIKSKGDIVLNVASSGVHTLAQHYGPGPNERPNPKD
ncbi:uncharacterized protein [Arachis hypogaea]|uniref:uncharacterized protein n=1 Tax=Arachis hypogaea TaxID=3818 RepID=UPI003B21313B